MQRRVFITGAGVISSLGDSPSRLHARLCEGQSGLQPLGRFHTDALHCRLDGEITSFAPKTYLGEKNIRPLDRTGQLAASAAQLALDDSGWSPEMRTSHEVGIVLGTMFCSLRSRTDFDKRAMEAGPGFVSPIDFPNTVLNAAAGQTAIWHNLRGVNSTIMMGSTSGLQAIAYATDLISSGREKAILAGGVEELSFECFYIFDRAGLLCNATEGDEFPIPFDARRNGFALGEGAALLMLEDAEQAVARGARVLGEIKGHGSGLDGSRGKDGGKAVRAIQRSMQEALDDARLSPGQIDCLSASANGSVMGDQFEAQAIEAVFNGRAGSLPITAIKSMLGETLGASGAMQAVAILEAMRNNQLPGIRQLEELGAGLPLRKASADNREAEISYSLINSIGFDWHCCSLVLAKHDGAK